MIWTVPDFSVERYHERLREMHERIEANGPFVAHSTRLLVEARKPQRPIEPLEPRLDATISV